MSCRKPETPGPENFKMGGSRISGISYADSEAFRDAGFRA